MPNKVIYNKTIIYAENTAYYPGGGIFWSFYTEIQKISYVIYHTFYGSLDITIIIIIKYEK